MDQRTTETPKKVENQNKQEVIEVLPTQTQTNIEPIQKPTVVESQPNIERQINTPLYKSLQITEQTKIDQIISQTPPKELISAPAQKIESTESGLIRKSNKGKCHSPASQYYSKTVSDQTYPDMESCVASGGIKFI